MQYHRGDRLLVVLALLRLGLLHKRVLLFVNSIDAGFRLRLFLESFGLRAAVLNAELPVNSRHHILQVCPCAALYVASQHEWQARWVS